MRGERDTKARAAFLAALEDGASVAAAARAAGVKRQTPYQWAQRGDSEVGQALEAARARGGRGQRTDLLRASEPESVAAVPPEEASELRRLAVDRLRRVLEDDHQETKDHIAAARVALSVVVPRPSPAAPAPAAPERKAEAPARSTAELLKMLAGGA